MSYAIEELRTGIVEMFSDAAQQSRYLYSYNERAGFSIIRRSTSDRRCDVCGSMSRTHRCVVPDKVPPDGFSCWAPPVSIQRQERLRVAAQARYQRIKKLSEGPRHMPRLVPCETCGSRAPEHRCITARCAT